MARRKIRLKYAATCDDCGAELPVGAEAHYYWRRGRHALVYGIGCHPRPQKAKRNWRRDDPIHQTPKQDEQPAIQMHEGPDGVWVMDSEGNVTTISQ